MSIISEALKQAKDHKREKVNTLAESDVMGTSGEMKAGTGFHISSSLSAGHRKSEIKTIQDNIITAHVTKTSQFSRAGKRIAARLDEI